MRDAEGDAGPALPAAGRAHTVLLPGPAGQIETLIAMPEAPRHFAVICHPHPLHGGALSNKVVYALAATALKCGFATARFNFRGVGKSEGSHDYGRGETEDTLAVVNWLRARLPRGELLLAGFSFGAFVSLKAASRARPALQVSIAPPFKYFATGGGAGSGEGEPLPPRPQAPWLVVHGRDDDVVAYTETQQALAAYSPPPQLITLDGVGHFFHGRLPDLQAAVENFVRGNALPV